MMGEWSLSDIVFLVFVLGYLSQWRDPKYPTTEQKRPHYKSKDWKEDCEKVHKRDRICQHCGETENLHVHHKTDLRFFKPRLKDLILLCVKCHKIEHHRLVKINKKKKTYITYTTITTYVALVVIMVLQIK